MIRILYTLSVLNSVSGLLLECIPFTVKERLLESCLVSSETGVRAESLSNFSVAIWTATELDLELTAIAGSVSRDAETARPSARIAMTYRTPDLFAHSRS